MYAAQANSPNTELEGDLDTTSREITVVDASVLPAVPFLLTIGYDTATSETVLVTAAEGNTLTVTRGIDGPAQIWVAGVKCARIFTAKDLNDIQTNIETIKTALEEAQGDLSEMESEKADQIIISGVEESSTAANSYSVGQYLILSGVLYRVTAAITAGDTITDSGSGANVAAATVGSELSGLRNTLNQLETTTAQLDQNMAYIESGNTASRTYAAGEFISWKGILYKATTAIPASTAFAIGTNLALPSGGLGNDLKGTIDSVRSSIPSVVNSLSDTSTTKALSAAQGKSLNDNKVAKKTLGGTTLANITGLTSTGMACVQCQNGSTVYRLVVGNSGALVLQKCSNYGADVVKAQLIANVE